MFPVVITTDKDYIHFCDMHGIYSTQTIELFHLFPLIRRTNPFGFPFFSSILHTLFTLRDGLSAVECSFYGYVNADILLDSRMGEVLSLVKQSQLAGKLNASLLLVGRRTNVNVAESAFFKWISAEESFNQLRELYSRNEQFMGLAMDYFLFTRSTFSRDFLPSVVVGRDMIDSYIYHYCHSRASVSVVDLSEGRGVSALI